MASSEIAISVQVTAQIQELGTIKPIIVELQHEGKIIKTTIVHVELNRAIEPHEVAKLIEAVNKLKKFIEGELVALSGRMPIWAFVAIAHALMHTCQALAVFEPKFKSLIVVASHTPKIQQLAIIQLPNELAEQLTQVR